MYGGIVFDEIVIQEDLQFKQMNGQFRLLGFVDLVKTDTSLRHLEEGSSEAQIANKVLQFVFLGEDGGFRFRLATFQ